MAEKIERTYTIPLRREYLKVPRYRRTEKASRALRAFLVKHMKSDDVKIGQFLNEHLWMHGMKNPPHHVKVNVIKVPEGMVYAELFGKQLKIPSAEKEKKEEKKAEEKTEGLEAAAEKAAPKAEKKEKKKKEKENVVDAEVTAEKEEKK